MRLNWYKKRKGFTMIELVVVVAMLSMLTLIGTMGYGMIQDRIKISSDKSTGALIGKELVAREMDVAKGKKIAAYPQVTVYDSLESIESYLEKGTIPESMQEGKFVATAVEVEENVTKIMVGIAKENETIPWQVYSNKDNPGWVWAEDMEINAFLSKYMPEDELETNDWTNENNKTEYAVNYNTNVSETVTNMPANQTKIRGVSLLLSERVPARENYTFKNWNTKSDGKGTSYTPGEIYIRNDDMELYAQWEADEYTVLLDHQSEMTDGTESIIVAYGSEMPEIQNPKRNYTVTFNFNTPEIANSTKTAVYTFGGYYTEVNGFGMQYYTETGASARNWDIPQDTTLYAKWTNTSVQLPSPSIAGYGFSGWYTAPTGGTRIGGAGASYTPTSDMTLFAHWAEGENTITLNDQGATTSGTSSVTASYGNPMPNIIIPERRYVVTFNFNGNGKDNITKSASYVFGGYYTEVSGKGTKYYTAEGVSARNWDRTNSITLYADWSKTGIDLPEATRDGYGFSGWYTESTGGTRIGGVGERYVPRDSITLYAHWGPQSSTIILDSQGATTEGTKNVTPIYGQPMPSITLPVRQYTVEFNYNGNSQANTTQTATYIFNGYYSEAAGSGVKYYNNNGTSAKDWDKTENTTLYAYWLNSEVTLPTPTSMTGYTFNGWYTNEGQKIGDAGESYIPTKNITLVARWVAEGSTEVILDNQGATTAGTPSIVPVYGSEMPAIQVPVRKYDVTYNYNGSGQINGIHTIQYLFEGYWVGEGKTGTKYYNNNGSSANNWTETSVNRLYASWQSKSDKLPEGTWGGHVLEGWYTAATGGTKVGDVGEDYTPTSNITLYAHWTENSYLITLNDQGATTHGTESVTVQFNSALPTVTPPVKEYKVTFNYSIGGVSDEINTAVHQFTGYYTSDKVKYYGADGKGVKNWDIPQDTMLYADWVTTNANVLLKTASRAGYTFDGWYTSEIDGVKIGETGSLYTPTKDITLYAHWIGRGNIVTLDSREATRLGTTAVDAVYGSEMPRITIPEKKYTVTFDKNTPNVNSTSSTVSYTFNGYYDSEEKPYYNGTGNSINNWDKTEDTTLHANWEGVAIQLPAASRTGYTFNGWYTAATGGEKIGDAGTNYVPTKNITLYAQWGGASNIVTLNDQGATTHGTEQVDPIYGLDMPEISIPKKEYTVTYDYNGGNGTLAADVAAYVFKGYYTELTGNGVEYYGATGKGSRTWDMTGGTTLYANWQQASVKLPLAARAGYTFNGWYTATNGGTKIGDVGASYIPSNNITIHAQWIANEYTVLLDSNKATSTGTTSVVATYGNPMPSITKPTKQFTVTLNYKTDGIGNEVRTPAGTFEGYYLNITNPATQYYNVEGTSAKNWSEAENSILYTKWTEGSIDLPTPSKAGYVFSGWYTEETWGTKVGVGGDSYTPTEDVTLYAQWADATYNIIFNNQGATTAGTTTAKAIYGRPMPNITVPQRRYEVTFNYNAVGIADSSRAAAYDFKGYFDTNNETLMDETHVYYGETGFSAKNWDKTVDTTLYAKWKSNSLQLPTPSRTGYTFVGWYTAANGGMKVGDAGALYTPDAAITVYAHWVSNDYTVILDGQGATTAGTTGVTATYDVAMPAITKPARAYTVTYNANGGSVSPTSATATYTFGGYYDATNGSGTQYYTNTGASARTWNKSSSTTLYAKWTSASVTLPTPTRTGYTFAGWYTAATNGTSVGAGGASYTPSSTLTIYAHWTANTYTVTLDQQSATTNGTTSVTATYDAAMPAITKPARAYTVTYNANGGSVSPASATATYTFGGYYDQTGGAGTQYYKDTGASARTWNKTSNTTLYAKWTSASITLPTPTRTGYTFAGWWTAATNGTSVGAGGASYTPSSTLTIYAHWTANTYTVTLNNQSATTAGTASVTATYAANMPAITPPAKTGYTFGGYYTSTGGGGTQYYTAAGVSARTWNLTSATTLYAKWTANTYTVTLNNQGASTAGTASVTATYAAAMPAITKPAKTFKVTYNYNGNGQANGSATATYTFGGYYDATGGGGTQYYTDGGASARAWDKTSNTTLYAKWTGGSVTLPTPTARTGYTFAGWYTASSGGTKAGNAGASYSPTADITLYGHWTAKTTTVTLNNQSATTAGTTSVTATYDAAMPAITKPARAYTVTYNANGGSVSPTSANATYTFGGYYDATGGSGTQYYTAAGASARAWNKEANTATLYAKWTGGSVTLPTPTRSGYTFTGWTVAQNGSGTSYAAGASYTATAATTFYAQWRLNVTLAVGNYVTYNPPAGTYTALRTGISDPQTYTPSATTKWKVFSVSASGVEIIPENGAGTISYRGENSYVPGSLESIVSNFINPTYADSARHLGLPREESVVTGTWPYTITTYEMNASDRAIINANPGLNSSEPMTFVGGTKENWGRTWTTDYDEVMASDGTTSFEPVFSYSDDDENRYTVTGSIRPIVKLKSTVFVTGGSGTSASPYTLGI